MLKQIVYPISWFACVACFATLSPQAQAQETTIEGMILGQNGSPVQSAHVAIFDGQSQELLQTTTSDDFGHFELTESATVYHLGILPAETDKLTGQWIFDCDASTVTQHNVTLEEGRPVSVSVRNAQGAPLSGVSVRAYDSRADMRGNIAMKVEVQTDASGNAAFMAPRNAHIAVMDEERKWMPAWAWRQRIEPSGATFAFELLPSVPTAGRVVDAVGTPLQGKLVSSWGFNDGWHWNGFSKTASDGSFEMAGGASWSRVRAIDPDGQYLSSGRRYKTLGGQLKDVTMLPGSPLQITTTDGAGAGVRARVWVLAEDSKSWSWGGYTDHDGNLQTKVPANFGIIARPLLDDYVGSNLRNQNYTGAAADLVLPQGRELEVSVSSKASGKALADVEVRAYVNNGVYTSRDHSDANGKASVIVPKGDSFCRLRVCDSTAGRFVAPQWKNLNVESETAGVSVGLDELRLITGEITDLGGSLLEDSVQVVAWNADDRTRTGLTYSNDGTFSIPVSERYHLAVRRAGDDSRVFDTHHWWNQLPDDGVHARSPIRVPLGYFQDVQVLSEETQLPVSGVTVTGGLPRRVTTGADGWAKNMLFRPIYHLRNFPPPLNKADSEVVIPGRHRVYQQAEEDRTVLAGNPLEPIYVSTTSGSVVTGQVVGELEDGTIGPLPGIAVRTFGARRRLSLTRTDSNGNFIALAANSDAPEAWKTTLVAYPSNTFDPHLPETRRGLEISGTPANPTDVDEIELDPAAFAQARVVDQSGFPILDETVTCWSRRLDKGPRWLIGRDRSDADGNIWVKVAPKTWFRIFTRFWNGEHENLYLKENFDFESGQTVDLGDIEIATSAVVQLRLVTSVADAGGEAGAMSDVLIELRDADTNELYDWRRTDGSGEAQLRGPIGANVRLSATFLTYAFYFGGIGFEEQISAVFKPQESEPFTLAPGINDTGNFYIVSPALDSLQELYMFIQGLPDDAFSGNFARRRLLANVAAAGQVALALSSEIQPGEAKDLIATSADLLTLTQTNLPAAIADLEELEAALNLTHVALNDLALMLDSLDETLED